MRLFRATLLTLLTLCAARLPLSAAEATPETAAQRNLFAEYLGKSDVQISQKLEAAWAHIFYGGPADRLYYSAGDGTAYIADIASNDVRTEGMSYGMMIAVQMNRKAEFDALWRWAKKHMFHADGPRAGYFAWHCTFDGRKLSAGSASDGEEWFAMCLYLADGRWGSGQGDLDYRRQADALLDAMLNKPKSADGELTAIFDREQKQVVFVPGGPGSKFTDPSYHLPYFYEYWAQWDPSEKGRSFWKAAAATSRQYWHKAAHPKTGLMPEYSEFDGSPRPADRGDFRFDSWRILANVALDHAWFKADPWQVEQSNRVLTFLLSQPRNFSNQYTLDGKPLSQQSEASLGLISTAAVAGLAAKRELGQPFVQRLWDATPPSGQYRYYDGLLYFLSLLQVSGNYRVYPPQG